MHVLVTGATGYVGSHSVAHLLDAGHRVRLLVRDPARVPGALSAVGVDPAAVEIVTGALTDPDAVRQAMAGCDSVLHAAGVYSFHPRAWPAMEAGNTRSTEVVLEQARRVGADPIVHVSTFGALLPATDDLLTTTSPVGRSPEPYLRSKAAAETIARRHQDDGAPVVITYPLGSLGPPDLRLGDQVTRLRDALRGRMPIWPTGGFPVGDVRDLGRLHAAVLRPGGGPRRYLGPGRYVSTREYMQTLRDVTGRALPAVFLPGAAVTPVGVLTSLLQRAVAVHLPTEYGAIRMCALSRPVDNAATESLLGGPGYPLATSVADTIGWLHASGRLSARSAGRAAHAPQPA
jgi:dihydroflavonol-4-reductase